MELNIHKGNTTTRVFLHTTHNCICCDKEMKIIVILHPLEIKELLETDKTDIEIEALCDDEHFNRWTTIFKNEFDEAQIKLLETLAKEQA